MRTGIVTTICLADLDAIYPLSSRAGFEPFIEIKLHIVHYPLSPVLLVKSAKQVVVIISTPMLLHFALRKEEKARRAHTCVLMRRKIQGVSTHAQTNTDLHVHMCKYVHWNADWGA